MNDKQIHDALDSMLSGLEVSPDFLDRIQKEDSEKKKAYTGMRSSRKFWLIVCVVLILSAVCSTGIGTPMLKIMTKWDDQVFSVKVDMEKPMPGVFTAEKEPDIVSEVWGGNLAETMYDLNACTKVPRWKPERYALFSEPTITVDKEGFGNEVIQNYIAEDGSQISISIHTLPENGKYSSTSLLQHDNSENEVWVYGDVKYILLKNYQYHSLSWQENNCTVSIWGEFSRDEALKMVKSIYD